MTLPETLLSVWQQALLERKSVVELGNHSYRVKHTRQGLCIVEFPLGSHHFTGIEQNPQTRSRWAALARQGKRVMQFSCQGRYIGNVAEGRLTRYGAWADFDLSA